MYSQNTSRKKDVIVTDTTDQKQYIINIMASSRLTWRIYVAL